MKSNFSQVIESGGVVLTLTPDEVYVEFLDDPALDIQAFIDDHKLQLVEEDPGVLPRPSFFNEPFSKMANNSLWY